MTRDDAAARLAVAVDQAVRENHRAYWRGNPIKERQVRNAIRSALGVYDHLLDDIFELIKAQRDY
jgi:type I restriction enzyme R subunit